MSRLRLRRTANAVGITLNVAVRRTSGVAPFNVYVDATATVSTNTPDTFRKVWYAWSFGETSGPGVSAWTVGVQTTTRNIGNGPVNGHLYETPGTYTIQLIATDGVNTAFWSQTITAWDPNVDNSASGGPNYTGAKTVCFSTSGNFAGAPSGSTNVTTSSWDTVLATAEANGNGYRYMPRGGETFNMTVNADDASNNWSRDDVTVASFGGGGKFTVTTSGTAATNRCSPFTIGMGTRPNFQRLIIMDAHVTPGGTVMGTKAINMTTGGNDITLVRITGDGTTMIVFTATTLDYYNINKGGAFAGHQLNPGLGMWDCDLINVVDGSPGDTSTWAYGSFIYCSFANIQGNKFDVNATSTNRSHCLRLPHVYKICVANNRMQQPANQEHCIKLHSETPGTVLDQGYTTWAFSGYGPSGVTGGWTDYVWMTGNDVIGGVNSGLIAVGSPSGFGGGANHDVSTQVRNFALSGNKISSGSSATLQFAAMIWAQQGLLANNIYSITTSSAGRTCAIGLGDREYMLGSGPQTGTTTMPFANDVIVENESIYNAAGTSGIVSGVFVQTDAINCTVRNVILWAPNETGTISCVSGNDFASNVAVIASGYASGNNSSNVQAKQGTSPFNSSTPATLANFGLVGGSYAKSAGAFNGLMKDITLAARSTTVPSMGAVE